MKVELHLTKRQAASVLQSVEFAHRAGSGVRLPLAAQEAEMRLRHALINALSSDEQADASLQAGDSHEQQ